MSTLETVVGDRVGARAVRGADERRSRFLERRRGGGQRARPGLGSDRAARLHRGLRHRRTGPGAPLLDARRSGGSGSPSSITRWTAIAGSSDGTVAAAAGAVRRADDRDDGRSAGARVAARRGGADRRRWRSGAAAVNARQPARTGAAWRAGQRLLCIRHGGRGRFRRSVFARPSANGGRLLSTVPVWLSDSFGRHCDPDARVREIDRRRAPAEGHAAPRSALWSIRGGRRCSRPTIQARRSGRWS